MASHPTPWAPDLKILELRRLHDRIDALERENATLHTALEDVVPKIEAAIGERVARLEEIIHPLMISADSNAELRTQSTDGIWRVVSHQDAVKALMMGRPVKQWAAQELKLPAA